MSLPHKLEAQGLQIPTPGTNKQSIRQRLSGSTVKALLSVLTALRWNLFRTDDDTKVPEPRFEAFSVRFLANYGLCFLIRLPL